MTLVELLVVISILVLLLGAAIPVLSPASDSRRMREAARGLNTFITGAQARAMETGRPFGVAFKKLSQDTESADDNGVCLEVYYVEQPAPYAGFDDSSRVRISLDRRNEVGGMRVQFVRLGTATSEGSDGLIPELDRDLIPDGLFRRGDVIEVKGKRYKFTDTENDGQLDDNGYYISTSGTPDGELFIAPIDPTGALLNYNSVDPNDDELVWTEPLRYKILRQPIRTSNAPYQLPEAMAIDLEASGFANGLRMHDPINPNNVLNNPRDVMVMFSPEGSIERVYNVATVSGEPLAETLVSSNLFLLVGLRENIPAPATDFAGFNGTDAELQDAKAAINWLNGDAQWVTVGAQTGSVVSSENAFVDPRPIADQVAEPANRRTAEINAARDIARQLSGVGGR